jgi:hypothetical protein
MKKMNEQPKHNTVKGKKPQVTNIYQGASTEERIRLYLKICRYVMNGEELK